MPFGQYNATGPKNPYNPRGQSSGMQNLLNVASPFGTPDVVSKGQFSPNDYDTKLGHGATTTSEQFKGLPNTGFTPGANQDVQGGLLFQQRLRLKFISLVQGGMSHKDAAVHIQKSTGFHARTGQKLVAKTEFKGKKLKYAGQSTTVKHFRVRGMHHRPTRRPGSFPGTPAGIR